MSRERTLAATVVLISIIIAGIYFLRGGLTGLVFAEATYNYSVNQVFTADSSFTMQLAGSPTSLRLTGNAKGNGEVKIWLQHNATKLLVYNLSTVPQPKKAGGSNESVKEAKALTKEELVAALKEQKAQKEGVEISQQCIQTCSLSGIGQNVTIVVEVKGSIELNISQITYTTLEWINLQPQWNATVAANYSILLNESVSINLSKAFYDEDNDTLTFFTTPTDNLTAEIKETILTIIPQPNFTGTATVAVKAFDGKAFATTELAVTVGAAIGNITTNITENITSNISVNITENITTNITANISINITENITANATVNITINATENITGNATGNISINITENITTNATVANITLNVTENISTNITANITTTITTNATAANFTTVVEKDYNNTLTIGNATYLGKLIEDDPEFDVYITAAEKVNDTYRLKFLHNSSIPKRVKVEGNVSYTITTLNPGRNEEVELDIALIDGILPKFNLTVGNATEKFQLGKEIPEVEFAGNHSFIDRADDKIDVILEAAEGKVEIKGMKDVAKLPAKFIELNGSNLTTPVFVAENLTAVEEAQIVIEKKGAVDVIVKCDDFDFVGEECRGGWVGTTIPFTDNGTHINFTVYNFSGYGGASLTVLNLQSFPMVGGNWTVNFTTTGQADLKITGFNDTSYGFNGSEVQYLIGRCGSTDLTAEEIPNGVKFVNYTCNETGQVIGKVITRGEHTLKFRFGGDEDYAHNLAACGVLSASDTLTQDVTATGTCIQFGADDIFLNCQGFKITGDTTGMAVNISDRKGANVSNCVFLNFNQGINITRSNNSFIGNNTIQNVTIGIFLGNSTNNSIYNNSVFNTSDTGIYVYNNSKNNSIYKNQIYNVTNDGILISETVWETNITGNVIFNVSRDGIRAVTRVNSTYIINNNISGNAEYGILLFTDVINNSIFNNTIFSNANLGIYLFIDVNYTRIENNTIFRNKANDGILGQTRVANLTIYNNTILNNSRDGILLTTDINNSWIFKNWIQNNTQDGIEIQSASFFHNVTGNFLLNNTRDGIRFDNAHSSIVQDNNVSGNFQRGILFFNGARNSIARNNTVVATGGANAGLYIFTAHNITFANNTAERNANDGLAVQSSSENNTVYNNTLKNNSQWGIHIITTIYNTTVFNNLIFENVVGGIRVAANTLENNITGNIVFNNSGPGIQIDTVSNSSIYQNNNITLNTWGVTVDSGSRANKFFNNSIRVHTQGGINLTSAGNLSFENNSIVNNIGTGIFISGGGNITFFNDNVTNATSFGMRIEAVAWNVSIQRIEMNISTTNTLAINITHSSNITIRNSNLVNVRQGIVLYNATNSTFSNTTIVSIAGSGGGFNITNSNEIDVINNTVISATGVPGLFLTSTNNSEIINTTLTNAQDGIQFTLNAYNNNITQNNVYNNSRDGIRIITDVNGSLITNNNISNNSQAGIRVDTRSMSTRVFNNTVFDNLANGMYVTTDINHTRFENNSIYRNTGSGINFTITVYNATIFNNTINNNTAAGIEAISDFNNSVIAKNWLQNNSLDGVEIRTRGFNNNITGNIALDNNRSGIRIFDKVNLTLISNNNISGNRNIGLHVVDNSINNSIFNNTIFNNTVHGIAVSLSANFTRIENNTVFRNTDTGIIVDRNTSNVTIYNNTILNNSVIGISLNIINNSWIFGNWIQNNSQQGIYSSESYANNISGNIIINNSDGILFEFGVNNTVVRNNNLSGNSRFGIVVTVKSEHNLIENNTIRISGNHALNISNVTNATVENNTIVFASGPAISIYAFETKLKNNNISTADFGIYIGLSAVGTNITNASFSGTNTSIFIDTTEAFNTTLTSMTIPRLILNNTNGSVNYTSSLTIGASIHVLNFTNISTNFILVNSTHASALNASAQIRFLSPGSFVDPTSFVDFNDDGNFEHCTDPQCTTINSANHIYNVRSFTAYKIAEKPVTQAAGGGAGPGGGAGAGSGSGAAASSAAAAASSAAASASSAAAAGPIIEKAKRLLKPFETNKTDFPCLASTKAASEFDILDMLFNNELIKDYAGYKIIKQFNLKCAGENIDLTANIPNTFKDIKALRCRQEKCELISAAELEALLCGGKSISEIRKDEIIERTLKPEDLPTIVVPGKQLTADNSTLEFGNYRIEFKIPEGETVVASMSSPLKAIKQPPNPTVQIVGTPLVIKVDSNRKFLPAKLTVPVVKGADIDTASFATLHLLKNETWVYADGQFAQDAVTLSMNNIYDYIDPATGEAIFALMGVKCEQCFGANLSIEYDPGSRDLVVLVHGFATNKQTWQPLIDDFRLNKQPWKIMTFAYAYNRPIDDVAKDLADQLELHSNEYDRLYLVGHSLGALLMQQALHDAYKAGKPFIKKVRKAIAVGSPNDGSPAIEALTGLFNKLMNEKTYYSTFNINAYILKDLGKGRQIPQVPGIGYDVIAGTRPYEFTAGMFTVSTKELVKFFMPNDGITTTTGAQHVGEKYVNDRCKNYYELNITHTELIDNDVARRVIARIIAEDVAKEKPGEAIIGFNQYVRMGITNCNNDDVFLIIGKPISDAEASSPLNCACGNGVCGVNENIENCPQDCAVFTSKENFCLIAPIIVYLLLALASLLTGIHLVLKHWYGLKRKVLPTIQYAIVALSGLMLLLQYLVCAKPLLAAYFVFALLVLLNLADYVLERRPELTPHLNALIRRQSRRTDNEFYAIDRHLRHTERDVREVDERILKELDKVKEDVGISATERFAEEIKEIDERIDRWLRRQREQVRWPSRKARRWKK